MSTDRDEKTHVSDSAILELIQNVDEPVVTAIDVANHFGFTQQAAHQRLSKLHEEGKLDRKKAGARAVVWWIPGDYSLSEASAI